MHKHFTITYKGVDIQVEKESEELNGYVLKYPDAKFIMIDRTENDWVVEDRSGDYWTDADIKALGELIAQQDPEKK